MTNRTIEASVHASEKVVRTPAAYLRSLLTTAQHTMTIVGLSAVFLITLLLVRPDLARELSRRLLEQPALAVISAPPLSELMEAPAASETASAASASATASAPSAEAQLLPDTRKQRQWVTSWLSRRYRVAGDAANMLVSTAYLTAHEIKLDPLLILAVMAIESGLNPFAESPVGAQGLMQVMSKVHHERFQGLGGVQAALNPVANIRVGSLILKDYVTRGGSVEAGLKSYVGAAAFATDDGYGSRVMAEYHRLKQVSTGKKVPTSSQMQMAAAPATPAAAAKDSPTADLKPGKDDIAGL
ncbi:MAG: transglycosylase SLT domain-containing protein [Burkholderiaceae bacterium]|nr:transglycosylase SLT domain-containing protein [Burkholderiaceae bacterium]